MDIRKWSDKYSRDIKLVYNSTNTRKNYESQISSFLNHFIMEVEPKSIKLAGHNNVKTTLMYTHISDNLISKINSPLNNIRI